MQSTTCDRRFALLRYAYLVVGPFLVEQFDRFERADESRFISRTYETIHRDENHRGENMVVFEFEARSVGHCHGPLTIYFATNRYLIRNPTRGRRVLLAWSSNSYQTRTNSSSKFSLLQNAPFSLSRGAISFTEGTLTRDRICHELRGNDRDE